ncbi:MAG TPA: hypothetical protein DIT25_04155 [Candidatus Moranbacteria bacterium]|nr:hypothetical protein [Candidatus Moranbacteria bacterium]
MNKKLKIFLKILITAGFLVWAFFHVDWSEVWSYLISIDPWKLIIYASLIIVGIGISAYKWKVLGDHKNIDHSFSDYYRFYLTGTFINNFMPSFIGGDTFKAYQTGKKDEKYIEAASSVMMDRITGMIGLTILALLFSLLNLKEVLSNKLLLTINIILIISLVFDFIAAKTRNLSFWKKLLERIPQKIAKFIIELQEYSGNSRVMTRTIWLGIVFQFIGVAVANYLLFWSLGIKIGMIDYFSVIFLISLISSIPISINNIGLKEWAYVTFFGIYGLASAPVITVAILSRVIQMIISFLALPAYLKLKKG